MQQICGNKTLSSSMIENSIIDTIASMSVVFIISLLTCVFTFFGFVLYLLLLKVRCCVISLLTGLPDPFAKVVVDGSGQCHSTDTVRNTLDPKWNQHYDL